MKLVAAKWIGSVAVISLLGFSGIVSAGKIISTPSASGAEGFGGWNMDNVDVRVYRDEDGTDEILNGFDEVDGSYDSEYVHFESTIRVSAATSTPMAILKGKDFPVGEPPGIKIINDDTKVKEGKPQNCIMTTSYLDTGYLDSGVPIQTICSSGFQTHKRFKVNMQPASLEAGGAIDLVFNVEDDSSDRDYQVFQKINNYTGSRLSGFSVQLGTGVGPAFVPASSGVGLDKLSVWASTDPTTGIWDPEDLGNFAHGLFGPIDSHFPEVGFFDSIRASYPVVKAESPGISDTFESSGDLLSNYTNVPPGTGPLEQFGPWQYHGIEPYGIFFDDDGDETTDPMLMAFWGDTNGTSNYQWMLSQTDGFAVVDPATMGEWALNPLYYIDRIEDMLNLGLNYVITVGDIGTATITIRIIPEEYTGTIGEPGYIANPPPPLGVTAAEGVVAISPKPEFDVGEMLVFTLADGNTVAGNIVISLQNLSTGENESTTAAAGVIDMSAVVDRLGLYEGMLPTSDDQATHGGDNDGTMYAEPGNIIRITYTDNDPLGNNPTDETLAAGQSTFFVVPLQNGGAAVFDL